MLRSDLFSIIRATLSTSVKILYLRRLLLLYIVASTANWLRIYCRASKSESRAKTKQGKTASTGTSWKTLSLGKAGGKILMANFNVITLFCQQQHTAAK